MTPSRSIDAKLIMTDFFQSRISFEQPVQSFEDEEDDDDDEVSDLFYQTAFRSTILFECLHANFSFCFCLFYFCFLS